MGGSYVDYFSPTYLANLLYTSVDKVSTIINTLSANTKINTDYINLNEKKNY